MTATDGTNRPLQMPINVLPHLERFRVYRMLKDMTRDLVIHLPRDHLKHIKTFLCRHLHATESPRIILLIEPGLNIDIKVLAKQMIKDFGCFVITRRCVMDRYEKHDDYVPGCVSPALMSKVTKNIVNREPVPQAGWIFFASTIMDEVLLVRCVAASQRIKVFHRHTCDIAPNAVAAQHLKKMTETDSTKRPLQMPMDFLPHLERYRVYQMLKDMTRDLIVHLPRDHLKHMKIFLSRHLHPNEAPRMIILIAPDLTIDVKALAKQMIKDFGCFVVTRRCVMDRYEKHDDYVPGCVSPNLMSQVTRSIVMKEPVPQAGWLMFDHPCTVREARCLQQDGVLPTVTMVLMKTPPVAPQTSSNLTPSRNFFQQDFEGLKFAYKATLKEVHIDPEDDSDKIGAKCFNAVRAFNSGAQGAKQGISVVGAPSVYRVLLLGPRGSGRRSQAYQLAKHFGLVYLHFDSLFNEAGAKDDDVGERIRKFGTSIQIRAEAVKRRLVKKDCIDHGWVLTGYPTCGNDFELLDNMPTPPNRIIFLNIDLATCRQRSSRQGVDWCTGLSAPIGSGPRVIVHPNYDAERMEYEWDIFFTESLAELRAAAGITAAEVDATEPFEKVQVKIQAAVIAAPPFDIECCSQLRNVRAD